jgi:AcrR family transcriptional regulator
VDEEADEEDGVFVPVDLFYGTGLSDRRQRDRERRIVGHIDRRREQGARPGSRARGLNRADIVAAAIAIADTEGTDAISIRRIARDLHVGAMSLYWYVSSIEELHQLMLEQVQSETEAPEPTGDWRADMRAYAVSARSAMRRHPWSVDFVGIGPPSGPNDARNGERLMAALDGLGLDLTTTTWVLMTMTTYVTGAVLREIQETRWQRVVEERMAGMTEEEIAEHMAEFNRRIRESGQYPHIERFFEEDLDPDAPETQDDRFEFGLDCMLDGIAARIRAAEASAQS